MLWNPEYAGKMGVLDDAGEALGMAMLAWDITQDINTADPELINAAKDKLNELIPLGVKVDITQYETIANGKFTVHQAWSGDMIAARWYLPQGHRRPRFSATGCRSRSPTASSATTTSHPEVVAEPGAGARLHQRPARQRVSEKNFNWNGYQPPLTKLDARVPDRPGLHHGELDVSGRACRRTSAEGIQFYEQTPAVAEPVPGGLPRVPEWRQLRHQRRAGRTPATRFLWPSLAIPGTAWLVRSSSSRSTGSWRSRSPAS